MKALGASLLLIALLSVAKPVGAQQIYYGTLSADEPYTVNIDNAGNAADKAIGTIYYFNLGRQAIKYDILTVAAGGRATLLQVIPRGTRLISISLAAPAGGTLIVDIRQGSTNFSDTRTNGWTMTVDVQ